MEITTIGLDVARVAEIAVGLVALRVGGPAAVEADHAQQRQFVPDRRWRRGRRARAETAR